MVNLNFEFKIQIPAAFFLYLFRVPDDKVLGAVVLKCDGLGLGDGGGRLDRGVDFFFHDGHGDLVRVVESGRDATSVRTPG